MNKKRYKLLTNEPTLDTICIKSSEWTPLNKSPSRGNIGPQGADTRKKVFILLI